MIDLPRLQEIGIGYTPYQAAGSSHNVSIPVAEYGKLTPVDGNETPGPDIKYDGPDCPGKTEDLAHDIAESERLAALNWEARGGSPLFSSLIDGSLYGPLPQPKIRNRRRAGKLIDALNRPDFQECDFGGSRRYW